MPKDVKCQNCVNLKNDWCEKVVDSPVPDMVRDCQYFRQKTNADCLDAMSIEEKAQFLYSIAYARETPWSKPFYEKFCKDCPAPEYTLDDGRKLCLHECDFADGKCPHGGEIVWWLQQPAEEVIDNG